MGLEPRDVAAPPDALAWICAVDRAPGYWATDPADLDAARQRGDRIIPTETDAHGDRWIRGITEPTHLADHLSLADTVHRLAEAIDRHRTPGATLRPPDDPGLLTDEASPRVDRSRGRRDTVRPPVTPLDHADQWSEPHGDPWPPDPEDVLAAITDLFEHGTRQYRAADAGMADLHQMWDRVDGDDKRLLASYEEGANHDAERWGNDRFRVGYAIAASRALRRIATGLS